MHTLRPYIRNESLPAELLSDFLVLECVNTPDPALMKASRQTWQWWETPTTDERRSAGDPAQE
jgi:hypothetical protein